MSAHRTLTAHVVTREEAKRLVNAGELVFAVYEGWPALYSDEEAAWAHAERINGHVLDWETGEYA